MIQALLSYLIFLPNVVPPFGFLTSDNLQAFPVETFPWAFLFCLSPKLVMDRAYLILMAVFTLSMGVTIAAYGQVTNSLRSLFAILNASLIFYRLMGSDREEFQGLIKAMAVIFALNYATSLLQFVGLFPRFIGEFYQIFVPRFSPEIHDIGGRGVYGLFPEPAYSASSMHFTFAFLVLWWKLNPFERKGALAFVAMFIFDVVLNRSATALGMLVLFFLSFVRFKHLWKVGLMSIVLLVGSAILSRNLADPPRVLQIINNLFFTPETDDLFLTLLNESGFRLIGIWAGYLYGVLHPMGGGIGSWPVSSVAALEAPGIESFEIYYFLEFNDGFYLGIRPSAFAAGLFLEAGILGCLAFSLIFLRHFRAFSYRSNAYWRGVLNLFLFYYFLLGVIGDPTPFIMLGMSWLALTKYPPEEMLTIPAETANLEDPNPTASA
jgi:hypothetical protein